MCPFQSDWQAHFKGEGKGTTGYQEPRMSMFMVPGGDRDRKQTDNSMLSHIE